MASLIEVLLEEKRRVDGEPYDILVLTPHEDDETIKLAAPIINDTTTASGAPWA